jgi:hypothetical protein
MTSTACTYWKDAFEADEPDRASFEAHVAGCADCTRAMASVAALTSSVASLARAPAPPLDTSRLGPVLAERRRLDVLVTAFAVSEVAMLQFGGGGLGFRGGQRVLLVVLIVGAVILGVRWLQRLAMLHAFAAETLLGHLRVTTRGAERRGRFLVVACLAWVVLCFGMMPFSYDNPVALVWWLKSGPARLAFFAVWPALFAAYTWRITLPRLARLRGELEGT